MQWQSNEPKWQAFMMNDSSHFDSDKCVLNAGPAKAFRSNLPELLISSETLRAIIVPASSLLRLFLARVHALGEYFSARIGQCVFVHLVASALYRGTSENLRIVQVYLRRERDISASMPSAEQQLENTVLCEVLRVTLDSARQSPSANPPLSFLSGVSQVQYSPYPLALSGIVLSPEGPNV